MNQLSPSGWVGTQQKRPHYILWLHLNVLDTSFIPTSMGLNLTKLLRTHVNWQTHRICLLVRCHWKGNGRQAWCLWAITGPSNDLWCQNRQRLHKIWLIDRGHTIQLSETLTYTSIMSLRLCVSSCLLSCLMMFPHDWWCIDVVQCLKITPWQGLNFVNVYTLWPP